MAYCSDQAHSSLQKAALIGLVKMRYVESDDALTMRGPKLLQAIKRDREKGLIPFWVSECCCFVISADAHAKGLAAYREDAFPQITNWVNLLKTKAVSGIPSGAINTEKSPTTARWVQENYADGMTSVSKQIDGIAQMAVLYLRVLYKFLFIPTSRGV